MVDAVSNNTAIIDQYALDKAGGAVDPNQLLQDDFLMLMTEQLKAQDPMSPTDNGEFLSQMAQFSSASSMSKLQTSFENFAEQMMSTQTLNAASLIDKEALLPTSTAVLQNEEESISGAIDLPVTSGNVSVAVYDAGGNVIKNIPMGSKSSGMQNFKWDGTTNDGEQATPGNYEFFAEFGNADGTTESALVFLNSRIDSVSLDKGNITLNTANGNTHSLADVKQIG